MKNIKFSILNALFSIILLLLISLCSLLSAQNSPRFYKLQSYSGEINLTSLSRFQDRYFNESYDKQNYWMISGSLLFKTKSYFWHPQFLTLNVDAEYSPGINQNKYLVIPDRSEVRTIKKLDISTVFLNQKIITLSSFLNLNQTYSLREKLTNISVNSKNWGSTFFIKNKYLPLSLYYNQGEWEQKELGTDRAYTYYQTNYQAHVSKSFFYKDRNDFNYSYNTYTHKELNLNTIKNAKQQLSLNNIFYLDKKLNYQFNSFMNYLDQKGNENYKTYQSYQSLFLKLPADVIFKPSYNFDYNKQAFQTYNQNSINGILTHKLYESLTTDLTYEYHNARQTDYHEVNNKYGINFMYEKKIPAKGLLTLSYSYFLQPYDVKGSDQMIQVSRESYVLTDSKIVLLKKPLIDENSIEVKDVTGTLPYRKGFDYFIIKRGEYLEIQRSPLGQIRDKDNVYINYQYTLRGSNNYTLHNDNYYVSFSFFKRFIEVYYRNSNQKFSDIRNTDSLALNFFNQTIYGGRLDVGLANGGVEYENNNSSILPYKMVRYYISLQNNFKNVIIFSVNSNMRDYLMLKDTIKQKFYDVSGMVGYVFKNQSKISFELAYRKQTGYQIDLDLITAKTEYSAVFGRLYLKVGFDFYNRRYLSRDKTIYEGAYIQISRKF